jgi:PilZ domain
LFFRNRLSSLGAVNFSRVVAGVRVHYRGTNDGKRRWRRHKSDAPIKILADNTGEAHVIEGRCVQVSEGGMCFFALGNFTPGTEVCLEFVSPSSDAPDSGKPGRIRGTIRNRAVYLYGVEYDPSNADA